MDITPNFYCFGEKFSSALFKASDSKKPPSRFLLVAWISIHNSLWTGPCKYWWGVCFPSVLWRTLSIEGITVYVPCFWAFRSWSSIDVDKVLATHWCYQQFFVPHYLVLPISWRIWGYWCSLLWILLQYRYRISRGNSRFGFFKTLGYH